MKKTESNEKSAFQKKHLLIVGAVFGIVLLLIPKFTSAEKSNEINESTEVVYYSEKLEKKIKDLICSAEGVGEASVVITLDGTGELVYAQNEEHGKEDSNADYVIVKTDDGEKAVLISEIYPKVRGVAVVCSGGNDSKIKTRVTELISAALGIPANKIAVSG